MKEFAKKKWTIIICWVILLMSLFPLFVNITTDHLSLIITLNVMDALIICAGICIFAFLTLSYINRDDDKYIFLLYALPILITIKTFHFFYIPTENINDLLEIEPYTMFKFIDQLFSIIFSFTLFYRFIYWNKSFSEEKAYRFSKSHKKVQWLYFVLVALLCLIPSIGYIFDDLFILIELTQNLAIILYGITIFLYLKDLVWKRNFFEFYIFFVMIGAFFVRLSSFLAIEYHVEGFLILRAVIECLSFFVVLISFMFSTYMLNINANQSKKTLVINNIKLQLAKERLEKALMIAAEKEVRISTIMDNIEDAIVTVDSNFKIESFNYSAEKMFGYVKHEVLGKSFTTLIPKEYHEDDIKIHKDELETGTSIKSRESYRIRKDGTIFPVMITSRQIEVKDDRIYIKIIRNITRERKHNEEIKLYNENLLRAKEEAEKANKLKTQVLTNITHELRTPMNSILGFSKLILKNISNTEKTKEFTQIIHSNGRRLLSLINSILDLSSVESGKTKLHLSIFKIRVLEKLKEVLLPIKKDKDIEINFIFDEQTPYDIRSDEEKITQIILNLAGNAIKFTESGFVNIRVAPYKADDHKILISIEDSGIGIDRESLKHIFDEFYQIEGEAQEQKGSGLGLSISYQLVSLLGGTIWVESEVNVGTKFHFTLSKDLKREITISPLDNILNEQTAIPERAKQYEEIEITEDYNSLANFDRYQDEPIMILAPTEIYQSMNSYFGFLPITHYETEENVLAKNDIEHSIVFIYGGSSYKSLFKILKQNDVTCILINDTNEDIDQFIKDGFSEVIDLNFNEEQIDSILIRYSDKYDQNSDDDEMFKIFLQTALEEISRIQFFRKSDILRELNELIANSPKKYHKTLKQCIKDVEHHNKESFQQHMKELIEYE